MKLTQWHTFKSLSLVWLASLFILPQALAAPEPEIIDIRGALYARLNLHISTSSQLIPKKVLPLLQKNLLWSGLFDLKKRKSNADLILSLRPVGKGLSGYLITQDSQVLFNATLKLSANQAKLESHIVDFVDQIVFALTGQKSLLGSAFLYSEKTKLGNRILLVDMHHRFRKVLVQDLNYNILPRWAPDGKSFLYTANGQKGNHIMRYDFATGAITPVAKYKGISSGGSWDKSAQQIVVTISKNGNPDLYVVNLKGKILRQLTRRSSIETSAHWSPNGKNILFASNRSGGVQVYKTDLTTKSVSRLTFEGNYNSEPQWNLDGTYIVYSGRVNGVLQIFLMNRNGEFNRQLTKGYTSADHPSWSPDGRQIVFTKEFNGVKKISILTSDGQYERRLNKFNKNVNEITPSWTNNFDWSWIK